MFRHDGSDNSCPEPRKKHSPNERVGGDEM